MAASTVTSAQEQRGHGSLTESMAEHYRPTVNAMGERLNRWRRAWHQDPGGS
jgi:hypothetical protein